MTAQSRATISGRTALYAILAHPVAPVRTPQRMNAHFDAIGHDGVLVPVQATPDALATVVAGLRAMSNLRGIVVTVPHKEAVVPLLDGLTPEARQVGAVNAIRRDPDGRLTGGQFDGEGFVAGLRAAGHGVADRSVFLAGAGGAAAGIAFALGRHGAARITIHNRTTAKAEALAERVRAAYPSCAVAAGGPDPAGHEIVVNATSLGMRPGDPPPFDLDGLAPPMLAAEVIIEPAVTPFLAEAARRGCATHGGEPMLMQQLALLARFMGAD
jgi:shikimate dehydrogenase